MTAAEMTDDPEIVGRAARGGVIAVAACRHQGLGAEIGCNAEVAADEGDGAARVQRMTLDAMLAELARPGQGAIDPLQALVVAAEPRLRDAVEQLEGRILELALVARAQELDDRGMMAGSRECAGFCDDRRRLGQALVAGLVFGHWDVIPRLPADRPLHHLCDRVFAEVRQGIRERLLFDRLARAEF